MLRQVSQLGQGALGFPEKKPETSLFLGKKIKQHILNVVFVEACYYSTNHKLKLYFIRLGCICQNRGTEDISSRYVNLNNSCYIQV